MWTGSGASCCITGTPAIGGAAEVEAFLTHLAVAKRVPASTQAKSAVLFLYKKVLGEPLPWLEGIESAKRPERLPVVLTREEVESILAHLGHCRPETSITRCDGC